jgi:tetratricopeptide (TPR) repeat protein
VKLAWTAFFLLLIVAIGVLYYLPKSIQYSRSEKFVSKGTTLPSNDTSKPPASSSPSVQGGLSPWAQAQLAQDRQTAEQVLTDLLEKQSELESKGAAIWGTPKYQFAQAKATQGDEAFRQNHFKAATRAYSEAVEFMDQLLKETQSVLNSTLKEGWEAFAAGNSESAKKSFKLAAMIDPKHDEAKRGLARAETLDQVLALLESGRQHELQNNLPLAQTDFQQASKLDPEFEPVQAALLEINNKLRDISFKQIMSEGFTALNRQDYKAAHKAFERASHLKPQSQEPLDGLAQVDLNHRLNQITEHQQRATSLERQEHWEEATEHYIAALKLDPTLVFAQQGKIRSLKHSILSKKLNYFIQNPQRLASKDVLDKAVTLKQQALAGEHKGPIREQQIARLSKLIEQAQIQVPVRLESDNLTNVIVYKVGRLGSFNTRQLELRPGTYTAVGTRPGYRDVRRQFTIAAGKIPAPLVVRCEEKI